MMVNRYECKSCGNTVDTLHRDGYLACAECMDLMEFAGKVGSVQGVAESPSVDDRSFSGAFTNSQFEKLEQSDVFFVQDRHGMGTMSEYDVFASVVVRPTAETGGKEDRNE